MFCAVVRLEDVAAGLHGKRELVAIDTETNGLGAGRARLIEVAAVRITRTGKITKTYSSVVNPGPGYIHGAEHVHGIDLGEVLAAPPLAEVLADLIAFVGDRVVAAHNLPFDNGVLGAEFGRAGMDAAAGLRGFCTLSAARRLIPGCRDYKLASLAELLSIPRGGAHRARHDAETCARVAVRLIERLESPPPAPAKPRGAPGVAPRAEHIPGPVAVGRPNGSAWAPSAEQAAVRDAFLSGSSLKILAGAGTGKTSTLELLARSSAAGTTYLAFNRSVAAHASQRLGPNVDVSTVHALAYRELARAGRRDLLQRLGSSVEPMRLVAERLGISKRGALSSLVGADLAHRYKPAGFALMAVETVARFCHSSSTRILAKHAAPSVAELPASSRRDATAAAVLLAEEYWQQVMEPGSVPAPITHGHYLKVWLLSRPKIRTEGGAIFIDEAQDISPGVVGMLKQQKHLQRVFVGDSNQAIYGFAGAADALPLIQADASLPLTRSWRFGPRIAELANRWLATLGAAHLLTGSEDVASSVGDATQPDAVLTRLNATAVQEAVAAQRRGLKVATALDVHEVGRFLDEAEKLQNGYPSHHPRLMNFLSWREVLEHDGPDAAELRTWARLVTDFGVPRLRAHLSSCVAADGADLFVTTAHRAKGLEWGTVKIADDFAGSVALASLKGPEAEAEERRLAYVAVTRARRRLDPGPLGEPA